jgi:hypothetical protein
MADYAGGQAGLPDPPYDADVYLGGFDRIDMPIDWLSEDWALGMSPAGMGVLFRLYTISLRQPTAGSLPADPALIAMLLPANTPIDARNEALSLWHQCSDGRLYWDRVVPLIEDAWGRKRGKATKDSLRKRRERLAQQLVKCGLSEDGAKFHEVQDAVMDQIPDGARHTFDVVYNAAKAAGVIGNIRTVRPDAVGQSKDSPRTVGGQSTDSCGTVRGQFSDSPYGSRPQPHTRSGVHK